MLASPAVTESTLPLPPPGWFAGSVNVIDPSSRV
jgi:hypothetical protein